jgi:hypothetical protein
MIKKIAVVIFSFNRPADLRATIESWKVNANWADIYIYDDDSDNKEQLDYLDFIIKNNIVKKVWKSDLSNSGDVKSRGGLYLNMQRAYQSLNEMGVEYMLFTQDDIQLVRSLSSEDVSLLTSAFQTYKNIGQIDLRFSTSSVDSKFSKRGCIVDQKIRIAIPGKNSDEVYDYFAAVGLMSIERYAGVHWLFAESEVANCIQSKKIGLYRAQCVDPFMMHTPWPTTFKRRKKNLILLFTEFIYNHGFYPYEYMSQSKIEQLLSRREDNFASAMTWLTLKNNNLPSGVWNFCGADRKVRRIAFKIKVFLLRK